MTGPVGFSIGYVSLQTGLSTHVIRAWERRYGAVSPQRSAGGRRLFSPSDIDRLSLLKELVDAGHAISQIGGLDGPVLMRMKRAAETNSAASRPPPDTLSAPHEDAGAMIEAGLAAVASLDAQALSRCLRRAAVQFSHRQLLEDVIRPLAERIGRQWSVGRLRIVHGHLAWTVIHGCLVGLLDRLCDDASRRPCLMLTTPAGQHCVMGALAVAITAQDHGWNVVFLGPNLPAEEIVAARSIIDPQLVALSITCRLDDAFMRDELHRLGRMTDGDFPLVVGGRASRHYADLIASAGGELCGTTSELVHWLQ